MLTNKPSSADFNPWIEANRAVSNFITTYASKLAPHYQVLFEAQNALDNALKLIFNTYISPALIASRKTSGSGSPKPEYFQLDVLRQNLPAIKNQLLKLAEYKAKLVAMQKKIKGLWFLSADEKIGRDLLDNVAVVVHDTIVQAESNYVDLQKMVDPKLARLL